MREKDGTGLSPVVSNGETEDAELPNARRNETHAPSDALGIYLKQMGEIPRLAPEEERECALRIERYRGHVWKAVLYCIPVLEMLAASLKHALQDEKNLSDIEDPDKRMEKTGKLDDMRKKLAALRDCLSLAHSSERFLRNGAASVKDKENRRARARTFHQIREEILLDPPDLEYYKEAVRIVRDNARLMRELFDDPENQQKVEDMENRVKMDAYTFLEYASIVDDRQAQYASECRRMVESNLRFVVSVAKKYRERGLPFLDLIQEGNTGLMHAIEMYESKFNARMNTYAAHWIRQRIKIALANHARSIRIPAHLLPFLSRLNEAEEYFTKQGILCPTIEQLSKASGIPVTTVVEIWPHRRNAVSLESPLSREDEFYNSRSLLEDQYSGDPGEILDHQSLQERLPQVLKTLTSNERTVIELRYGLNAGREVQTLEDIAKILGITRERVRQIQAAALQKLRHPTRSRQLEEFR